MAVGLKGASRRHKAGQVSGNRSGPGRGAAVPPRDCGALRAKPRGRGPGAILAAGGSFLRRAGEGKLLPPLRRAARSQFGDREEKHGNWSPPNERGQVAPGTAHPDAVQPGRLGLRLPLVTPGARRQRTLRQFSHGSGAKLRNWWGQTLRNKRSERRPRRRRRKRGRSSGSRGAEEL